MRLNFITNADKNLQEKMRFFSDYFLFVNQFLGNFPDIPFDNPYSLLNKIISGIKNESRKYYIEPYFKQLFYFYDGMENKNEIEPILKFYNQYKSLKLNDRVQWVIDNETFIEELKKLYTDYESNLFDEMVNNLYSYISCKHTLTEHLKEIKYCTQILVSQFRFNGYSKTQVDSSIDRILSKDNFPFPDEIFHISDPIEQESAKKVFLDNRDFQQQFFGLKNLLQRRKSNTGTFIYAIENCKVISEVKDSFKVKFNTVTFISSSHPLLKEIKNVVEENIERYVEISKTYFQNDTLLAYVTLNYDTPHFSNATALNTVKEELQQFNQYINSDLRVKSKDFLFTLDFTKIEDGSISLMDDIKYLRKDDLDYLNRNPYEALRLIKSDAKDQLLYNETVFFKGVKSVWKLTIILIEQGI